MCTRSRRYGHGRGPSPQPRLVVCLFSKKKFNAHVPTIDFQASITCIALIRYVSIYGYAIDVVFDGDLV
ncbi:MAG: hypothetical protein ACK56F_20875 [bacterium]